MSAAISLRKRLISRGPAILTRQRLEQAIERAIAALDALDGDPDLEDGYDREICCEDEGENDNGVCTWPDEGDQTTRRLG